MNTISPTAEPRPRLLALIGPGILVAATGVGAGDLATASFAGSQLGTAILWAALVGAFLKFVLNEGLARWQLATGMTVLEGAVHHFGRAVAWLFLPYLLLWSLFVGAALMSGCGVALHAMIPLFEDAEQGKIVFGAASSMLGLVLVRAGGFALFEKIMGACIALMFITVVLMAVILWPGAAAMFSGLLIPSIPDAGGAGLTWTVALMGGVGGTLTVLCYGHWIREEGRSGLADLWICRLDLGLGYLMTALFAVAMIIVGSTLEIEGSGAGLLVTVAEKLVPSLGEFGRWLFLVGVLGAVVSSLLGVWQAVPYLFAEVWSLALRGHAGAAQPLRVDVRASPYRLYQLALATVPMLGLLVGFREMQKLYAVLGASFIPILALVLLVLNGRRSWVGEARNSVACTLVLVASLVFFAALGWAGLGD